MSASGKTVEIHVICFPNGKAKDLTHASRLVSEHGGVKYGGQWNGGSLADLKVFVVAYLDPACK
jgi:hypothetical protein